MTPLNNALPAFGNGILAGGAMLMLIGGAATLLHRTLPMIAGFLARRFTTTLEVRDQEVFAWVADWLAQQPYGLKCRNLSVQLLHLPARDERSNGGSRNRIVLVFAPGSGSHFFFVGRRWLWLRRAEEKRDQPEAARRREYFVIRMLGTEESVLKDLVRDALRLHQERRRGNVAIYCPDRAAGWVRTEAPVTRTLESVVLRRGVSERIEQDLAGFLSAREWYAEIGVPHRRGYLFYGPPGCGKSSYVAALAGRFRMDIYALSLAGKAMSNERLLVDLASMKPESILLIEDIDCAFEQRERTADNSEKGAVPRRLNPDASGVTLSGLLNAIDGLTAQEHRILILTTNHAESLDSALTRPGRIDVKEYFGPVAAEQAQRLFLRFFPNETEIAVQFGCAAQERSMSPANLQNILVTHRGAPRSTLSALHIRQAPDALRAVG